MTMHFHSGSMSGRKGGWQVLLIAAIAALPLACGLISGGSSTKEVAVGIPQEPKILNPVLDLTNEAKQITSLVFDGLTNPVGMDNSNLSQQYIDALAMRIIETNPDDRRFLRIELRPGIKWHNGVNFTADDVYFTYQAIHQSNSPLRVRIDRFIDDMKVVDSQTLEIRLREERIAEKVQDILSFKIVPQVYDPGMGSAGELPRNLRAASPVVNNFNWKPVGTGPYRIAERTVDGEVVLASNPLPVLGAAKIKTIQVKRYPGWDVLAKSLSDGSVQLVADVPPNFFTQLEKQNLANQNYSPYNFYAVVYNVRSAPLDDRSFRIALNQATDRAQLASAMLPDEPNVTQYLNESIYPHNYVHVIENPQAYASNANYDAARARQTLSRFSPNRRRIRLLYSSIVDGDYANSFARAYQQMMSQVGVQVDLENAVNISSYNSSLQTRRFQAALVRYDDLDHFYDLYDLFELNASKNYSGFVKQELTDKLSELKLTLAFDDVGRITGEIHRIIDDNAPLCPLFTLPKRAYFSPKFKQSLTINPEYYFNLLYIADFI